MPKIEKPTKKKLTNLPVAIKKSTKKKSKSSPIDYYHCLLTQAQNDWLDPTTGKKKQLAACCQDCKLKAPQLNQLRTQEIKKLITSYHQVGDSLSKLLQPIK